jgi:hypothetical protein
MRILGFSSNTPQPSLWPVKENVECFGGNFRNDHFSLFGLLVIIIEGDGEVGRFIT